ncbi:MAG: FIST C-terminal domain-containing protein, partial [Pseudomonadota bacterium]
DVLTGISAQVDEEIIITGAGASDNFHFAKTHQYYKDKAFNHSAIGLLLGGRMLWAVSSQHGWKPLGRPRTITKAEGHIIRTIDGKKAAEVYHQYFEKTPETIRDEQLGPVKILYPLGISLGRKKGNLIRNVLGILDDGSILCQDTVPENAEVHLMIGNPDSHLGAAAQAAKMVREQLANQRPRLVLIFESLLRYRILRRTSGQITRIIQDILGEDIPILGMYSWGEFVTFKGLPPPNVFVQNGNITLVAIG